MTVTIHFGGANPRDVTWELMVLAGDPKAVVSSHGGMTVSDELAYRYLASKLEDALPLPLPPVVVYEPKPLPESIAVTVREAENVGGLTQPRTVKPEPQVERRRRGRPRKTVAPPAPSEETQL